MEFERNLASIARRITTTLQRDSLIQRVTYDLQTKLATDRVVLYYFYRRWKGQVTFEALSDERWSILGSTGADDCFNDAHAALYEAGRVRAIADIETEAIEACHRDFLRQIHVRANLVVPILSRQQLWGLLVTHHCQQSHHWSPAEITAMQAGAQQLGEAPSIQAS